MPPPEFMKKVKETQRQETIEFLSTLLNQDLEPIYRPRAAFSYSLFSKLANSQDASRPVSSQEEHTAPPNNIFTSVRMTQTHKRPRQQIQVEMKSDWSTDSDDRKDNQARKKPIRHDVTSNWSWVKVGSPKPRFHSLEEAEQRHWQRQNKSTDNEMERPEATEPG